jgi:hypothetical protein
VAGKLFNPVADQEPGIGFLGPLSHYIRRRNAAGGDYLAGRRESSDYVERLPLVRPLTRYDSEELLDEGIGEGADYRQYGYSAWEQYREEIIDYDLHYPTIEPIPTQKRYGTEEGPHAVFGLRLARTKK